ncbi:DUF3601 domain-containing protein [Myxococcota bacterium]|nr:DUF3601 domain-containing protein [Myxococcota bacterium]
MTSGADSEPFTPSDYGLLLAGQVYRTVVPYADFDGVTHAAGETWTFLGHHYFPHDSGLTLYVRAPSGGRTRIRLLMSDPAQARVADDLRAHFEHVAELAPGQALWCACDQSSWTVVGELSGVEVLLCATCGIMLAVEATATGAHHMVPLDAVRRRELERAAMLVPDAPLDDVIHAALTCTNHPANLLVATRLAQRPTLLDELAARLRSDRPEHRVPVLDMVSKMRPVPPALVEPITDAFLRPIDDAPVSDERFRALMALYPIAADAKHARPELVRLLGTLDGLEGELPDLMRRVAKKTLTRIDG